MDESPKQHLNKKTWIVLITVMVGTFLGRLDQTIVNLALPNIIDDYGISVSAASWIATAYIIANAIFVPIWGKLGDTWGRKKVYILGFVGFIIGSILAGFAWNLPSMVIFRIIQAIAGSADYPTAMAIIASTFPQGKPRAQALGIWSASFAAASVFGPLLGGPLIDTLGWRSVFLVNFPVGLLGLYMAMKYIDESKSETRTLQFDLWGAVTLGGALSALVLVLEKGLTWGWFSPKSLIAYLLIVLFTYTFVRIEDSHPEPIVDLKFFRIPVFVNTLGNNFIVFMGMMGSIFLVPVFVQTFLGYNAKQTGYIFMPMAAGMMMAAPFGGRLTGRVEPRYVMFASTIVAALGIFLLSFLDPKSGPLAIMIPMFIMAFGLGFGMAQRTNVIAAMVPENEIGVASSVLALARNIAGAFGIAVFGTILTNTTQSKLLEISSQSIITSSDPLINQEFVTLMIMKAQVSAYSVVFIISSIILVIGAFGSLFIKLKEGSDQNHVEVEA